MVKILAAGDLHGDKDLAEKLSRKAKRNNIELIVLAGDIHGFHKGDGRIFEPFVEAGQKVLFVPGNWDSSEEHEMLKKSGKSLHCYYVTCGDVGIAGIGNPDWKMSLDKNDLAEIKRNFDRMKPKKRILVSHLHPSKTKSECCGFLGDKILREAVEKCKPDLLVAAHIHEAEGIEDKIGETRVVQVGRKGTILEL